MRRAMDHPAPVLRSMETMLALWDDLRTRRGPFYFVLRGSSMWPAAPDGSLIAVTPCSIGELRSGDLVTFRMGGRIITHRVFRVVSGGLVTWGDSLLRRDPVLPGENVLGRASLMRSGPLFGGRLHIRLALRRLLAEFARKRATG